MYSNGLIVWCCAFFGVNFKGKTQLFVCLLVELFLFVVVWFGFVCLFLCSFVFLFVCSFVCLFVIVDLACILKINGLNMAEGHHQETSLVQCSPSVNRSSYSGLCPSTARSNPVPESSNFLCALLSLSIPFSVAPPPPPPPLLPSPVLSLQQRFDFPIDPTPFFCHCVLLMIHALSSILAIYPAHFRFGKLHNAVISYFSSAQ